MGEEKSTIPASEKLFARKATGLVREIGFLTAILIVLCNTVGLGWQKRVFQFSGPATVPTSQWVGGMPPMVMAFGLVGIIVLLSIYAFAALSAAMPRSGGGYVYISRIIHPAAGYVASWVEYLSIAVSYGMIAVAVMEALLLFGGLAGIDISPWFTAPNLFIIGAIIVFIFAAIACFGVKMTGRLLQVMFWIPAVITVLVYGLLLSANPVSMTNGIVALTGHTPTEFTMRALEQGMATAYTGGYWGAVGVAILGAYWAYIGYAASTFVGGEIKEAHKTFPPTLFAGGLLIIAIYMSASALLARACGMVGQVGGWEFFNAYSYLSYGGGSLFAGTPKAWLPVVAAYQAEGMGLGAFKILLVLFAAFWVANDIPPFIITSSRIIFAMAFDRTLPETLANVNERWHSPVNATIFTAFVALIGCLSEVAGDFPEAFESTIGHGGTLIFTSGVTSTDFWDGIFFTLMALAAAVFPYVKKDIYEKSPFKMSLGNVPMVSIIGAAAFIGNLWLDWTFLDSGYGITRISSFDSAFPTLFTIVLLIIFGAVYTYYKVKAKATGIDMTTIYAEIPPE